MVPGLICILSDVTKRNGPDGEIRFVQAGVENLSDNDFIVLRFWDWFDIVVDFFFSGDSYLKIRQAKAKVRYPQYELYRSQAKLSLRRNEFDFFTVWK